MDPAATNTPAISWPSILTLRCLRSILPVVGTPPRPHSHVSVGAGAAALLKTLQPEVGGRAATHARCIQSLPGHSRTYTGYPLPPSGPTHTCRTTNKIISIRAVTASYVPACHPRRRRARPPPPPHAPAPARHAQPPRLSRTPTPTTTARRTHRPHAVYCMWFAQ
eukprot:COSAG01_NODE_3366_length_6190_cov_7.861763_4_plen_165_part_00